MIFVKYPKNSQTPYGDLVGDTLTIIEPIIIMSKDA